MRADAHIDIYSYILVFKVRILGPCIASVVSPLIDPSKYYYRTIKDPSLKGEDLFSLFL